MSGGRGVERKRGKGGKRDGMGRARGVAGIDVGARGEAVAARVLRKEGFRVVDRNARVGGGEADLICVSPDSGAVIVVEVKARVVKEGGKSARPEDAITPGKRAKLRAVARGVAKRREIGERAVRVDVIAVDFVRRERGGLRERLRRLADGGYTVAAVRRYESVLTQ